MKRRLPAVTAALLVVLLANTAYIAAFASPTIFYMANVLAHLGLGLGLAVAVALLVGRDRDARRHLRWSLPFGALALALGVYLVRWSDGLEGWGNIAENRWALWGHVAAAGVAVLAAAPFAWRRDRLRAPFAAAVALAVLLPAGAALYRRAFVDPEDAIENSLVVPTSMDEEGGGPSSPFFPSSAKTNVGGIIPSNFFMDSKTCGECHKDIYAQWESSMHHFASFNNQFYRKSVEYMQSVVGTRPSKWCAGCHDHAVFFNGRFDRPISEQIDTPEAHAGLACTSCHAITHVSGSVGNGGFTISYPPLHELATSRNPVIRKLDRFLTFLDPEPHRKTFLKPFMRSAPSEFCASCHKVHLDVPVNGYRWFRGFNDYDNWQASGVSGQGARSFYYPKESQTCVDCHMPLVPSRDPGHHDGRVHSHRFAAANMAVPFANRDHAQMKAVEDNLRSGFITVDIFAVSPAEDAAGQTAQTAMLRRSDGEGPRLMSSFAVGEEAEVPADAVLREVGRIAAPIDRAAPRLRPGSTARVDVVVRTRKIGHFFPGGTVDAFDVWLELEGRDAAGRLVYWSGRVEDGGKGPVERGAHFYRSYQLDAEGNPINKRNAWQARSLLYVRLIPPGAADVAHFRVKIPADAQGPIRLRARLNYRKFSHYYTQFVYAGKAREGQDPRLVNAHANSLEYTFDRRDIPDNVSGQIKGEIPQLPIVCVAEAEAKIELGDARTETAWVPAVEKRDRERWNDWGIGLLLQGDLKGAEYAFKKVTEAEPEYADGWLNVARALIQEGETEAARPYVEKALQIDPKLGRIHFFKGMIEKAAGNYDLALASLRVTESLYPRDRVVLNQIGRVLFLKREYREAVEALERVLRVDPEDVAAHYTLMLCHRGLGETEKAAREEKLFRRFKAEESSQAITGRARRMSPEDNNERQTIHDHESVPLDRPKRPAAAAAPSTGGGGR